MSDQTKFYPQVQTLGPTDPNAPTRGKIYSILTVAFPLIGALATFGVLSADQANAITGFATASLGLAGAFGFGLAAKNTNKQINNGTFTEAPTLPVVPALEQMVIIRDQANQEIAKAQVQATGAVDAIYESMSKLPGGGLVAGAVSAAIPDVVENLVNQFKVPR